MSSVEIRKEEAIEVEQLRIGKHMRFKSAAGQLTVDASGNTLGVWVDSNVTKSGEGTVSIVAEAGKPPYMSIWPAKGYFASQGRKVPFAFSANGLQVPHPDGTVTTLSLLEISTLVKSLKG
jgi:hypothetical protein